MGVELVQRANSHIRFVSDASDCSEYTDSIEDFDDDEKLINLKQRQCRKLPSARYGTSQMGDSKNAQAQDRVKNRGQGRSRRSKRKEVKGVLPLLEDDGLQNHGMAEEEFGEYDRVVQVQNCKRRGSGCLRSSDSGVRLLTRSTDEVVPVPSIGAWCVLGDFNSVLRRDERRGVNEDVSSMYVLEMRLFNNFLGEMEVEDSTVLGRSFTWYHPNGRSMSRIDRVLLLANWSHVWGETSLWVLPRDVSDRCPLVLKVGGWDWGPRPFRFNNFWLKNRAFKGVVEEKWRGLNVHGWMGFVLKEKLKGLKYRIKEWNKEEYGGMEEKIELLIEEIKGLDEKGEVGDLNDGEILSRKAKFGDLWKPKMC